LQKASIILAKVLRSHKNAPARGQTAGEQVGVSVEYSNETDKGRNYPRGLAFAALRSLKVLQLVWQGIKAPPNKISFSHLGFVLRKPLILTINCANMK
jgi:hypothetical protein